MQVDRFQEAAGLDDEQMDAAPDRAYGPSPEERAASTAQRDTGGGS